MRRLASTGHTALSTRHKLALHAVGAVLCGAVVGSHGSQVRTGGYEQKWKDETDPFGERKGWDSELVYGDWDNVDTEAWEKHLNDPNVKKQHFGPDWARTKVQGAVAMAAVQGNPIPGAADASIEEREKDTRKIREQSSRKKAISPQRRIDEDDEVEKMPSTYEEFALKNLATEEEMEEDDEIDRDGLTSDPELGLSSIPDSLRSDMPPPDFKAEFRVKQAEMEAQDPITSELPLGCLAEEDKKAAAAGNTTLTSSLTAATSNTQSQTNSSEEEDEAYQISPNDPQEWSTGEVIAWLRKFGDIDDSMVDAFEMVHVDGDMLLNKVAPPDMFKQMRKWHLKRDSYKPQVTELLVQETIYLCYPYCRY